MTGQIIFILWRESVEALLVIGILASWLSNRQAGPRARAYLWGGVAAGLAVALGFAALVLGFSELLSGAMREGLMTGMVFLASALIVQMVVWMRRHGRTLKRELETGLETAARADHWGTVFLLAMLAVAREGSETVVFLYGTLTYAALRLGSRFLPWRWFFRVSEVVLLLLGAALFVTGVGDLVAAGLLPYGASLWDTGALLDDSGPVGGMVAALTGYRSAPDAVTLGAWIVYWGLVALTLRVQVRRARAAERAA